MKFLLSFLSLASFALRFALGAAAVYFVFIVCMDIP
jgi:hypothetical protein